jgi:predicted O-methyltransferase YrrM
MDTTEMDAERYATELIHEDDALQRVREKIAEHGMPQISINPVYGRLLTLLVATSGAREVLEIGALGGYSGICLARGLSSGGRLVSRERDADYARFAEQNVRDAGLGGRITLEYRVGDAHESLAALRHERHRFDFFFIDAEKEGYPAYLDAALTIARPGALIVADNAIYHGRVLDPADGSDATRAMRDFNRELMTHPRLTAVILPAFDGLALARVNS